MQDRLPVQYTSITVDGICRQSASCERRVAKFNNNSNYLLLMSWKSRGRPN